MRVCVCVCVRVQANAIVSLKSSGNKLDDGVVLINIYCI